MNTQINLEKTQSSYKMIIPAKVEDKIRWAANRFSHTEWSGVLWYSYKGTFEGENLVLTCEDILPMDIGNATFTEYTYNPEIIQYAIEHNLLDYQMGQVHSHHCMMATPSSTDMETLLEFGKDHNIWVSIIVNNAGKYTGQITRKVNYKVVDSSYSFFNNRETPILSGKEEYCSKVLYSDLVFEIEDSRFKEFDKRFDEIEEANKSKFIIKNTIDTTILPKDNSKAPIHTQLNLWDNNTLYGSPSYLNGDDNDCDKMDADVDKIANSIVIKLLTGDVTASNDNTTITTAILNLPMSYKRTFNSHDDFLNWRDYFVDYLFTTYCPIEIEELVAFEVVDILEKNNKNINYINDMISYITTMYGVEDYGK